MTLRNAPLWVRTEEVLEMICPTAKAEYFFRYDWTDKIRLISFKKFRFYAQVMKDGSLLRLRLN